MDLSVRLVQITNGRLTIRGANTRERPLTLDKVNIEVRNFTSTSAFPFSLSTKLVGGGSLKLDGKAGPIDRADASKTPVNATLNASDIDLAGTGLNGMAPDVSGLVSLDGSADSDGSLVKIKGKFKGAKLKLSKTGTPSAIPVVFDFALDHHMRKQSGTLRQGDIHIGKAAARITGDYAQQGDSMVLKMNFSGPSMAVEELTGMLPPLGIILPNGSSLKGGTLAVAASLAGPADKLNIDGTVALNKTKLTGFNLGQKMATIQKLAGIQAGPDTDIDTASANLHVTPAGTVADSIRFIVPAIGELAGGGSISPANALDFKMTAKVHTSGAAAIIADTPIPFFVQGTSAEPVFKPDLKAMASDKIKEITGGSTKPADLLKGLFGGKK
jgi:AsmA protein